MTEAYILKLAACSAIFLLFYHLFLEKQNNHHFKRFYLLGTMAFSVIVPLISIQYGVRIVEINESSEILAGADSRFRSVKKPIITLEQVLFYIYITIAALLFFRLVLGLHKIWRMVRNNVHIHQDKMHIVLSDKQTVPHSFWKYIFLNRADYESGKIKPQVLKHEFAHNRQFHTLDLLSAEMLLVIFWFNPAFYFYKKAILTNHEFLADSEVLKDGYQITEYQKLLLENLSGEDQFMTNSFNNNITKKRINMMTISKKPLSAVLSFATVPLATLMFFAFVQKVPAQVYESSKRPVNKTVRSEKLSQTETVKSVPSDNTTTVTTSAKKQEATIEIESISTENVKTDTIRPKKDLRNDDSVSASRRSQEYFTSENTLNEKDIIPAEYPGGYAALRQAIGENFNPSLMASNKGVFKGKIHFIIPADYPYPDIFYEFEDESFSAAIDDAVRKAMKAKWKPATKNGKPVDYTVIIPINMSFQ